MPARGTLGPLDACTPVADLQHTLAQLRRIREDVQARFDGPIN